MVNVRAPGSPAKDECARTARPKVTAIWVVGIYKGPQNQSDLRRPFSYSFARVQVCVVGERTNTHTGEKEINSHLERLNFLILWSK